MDGIKLRNVHKEYRVEQRQVKVLNGVHLEVHGSKITVILGRSGCGKTTLLRLIGGLEGCDTGTIEREQSEKDAFVFQEPRLMPWLSVYKNITFGLQKKEVRKEAIHEIIQTVGLDGFEEAFPHQLSGGMQQRVAIARALAYKPSFIMMDEPFAALDYFTREQMQKELLRMQRKTNCGIIFVTHSIDEALLLGDKIVVIENGSVKEEFMIEQEKEVRDLLEENYITLKKRILACLNRE